MNHYDYMLALSLEGKVSSDHPTQIRLRHHRNHEAFQREYYASSVHKFYDAMEKIYKYFWQYYCLVIENICVGFVVFRESHFSFNKENNESLKMVGLCVRKEKRGQGIGQRMLKTVLNVSDRTGCSLELAASAFETEFVDDYERLVNRVRKYEIGHHQEMFSDPEEQAKESERIANWYKRSGFQTCDIPKGVGHPPNWNKKNFLFRFSKKASPELKENMKPYLNS